MLGVRGKTKEIWGKRRQKGEKGGKRDTCESGSMGKEGRSRWEEKDGLREKMGNGVTMGGSR